MKDEGLHSNGRIFSFARGLQRGAFVIYLAITAGGCSLPGGLAVSSDTVPVTASYLTGGSLVGTSEVSGTAQVYLVGSSVLLHLEGLVTPAGTLYAVFLENGNPSTPFYFSSLKAIQGSQNYFTGQGIPGTHFTRVAIRATTSTFATEMAAASLASY